MTTLTIALSGGDRQPLELIGKMANRHGLIAGATGTGKTVTLRKMAESFSNIGVPVFLVDVKGDLSGICRAGDGAGKVGERTAQTICKAFPCAFGTYSAKRASPCALPYPKWGRCCSRA